MPSAYFPRQKALQHTVDVFLSGLGIEQISADYGFSLSKRLFPFRTSISLLKYSESCVNTNRETIDQGKGISALGALSRTFSLPSVSGTSCQLFQYHSEHMLQDSNQISSCCPLLRFLMSACSSSLGGAHFVAGNSNSLASKHGQKFNFKKTVYYSGWNRNPDYFRRVTTVVKNFQPLSNHVPRRFFMPNLIPWRCNLNLSVASGGKTFHSSSLFQQPNGAVCAVYSYGSVSEERHQDSMTSTNQTLKLLSGSCYLPHPDKEETGGEDAHFIWEEQAIGVADGVGGWADVGVDAGLYARELMSHSVVAIQMEPRDSLDPSRVLENAYSSTKAKGSSTACIIALNDQGIHAVNLGDSGFIVVRDGCTIFRSPIQQHDFNFTYQLESDHGSDLPSSAQVFAFPVAPGDAIVAGTDGLFDNLYNTDVTAVVVHAIRAGLGPQVTAQKIAALAHQRSQDKNRQTPFSTAAQEAGYRYYGGKLDDITVVVSYVTASAA